MPRTIGEKQDWNACVEADHFEGKRICSEETLVSYVYNTFSLRFCFGVVFLVPVAVTSHKCVCIVCCDYSYVPLLFSFCLFFSFCFLRRQRQIYEKDYLRFILLSLAFTISSPFISLPHSLPRSLLPSLSLPPLPPPPHLPFSLSHSRRVLMCPHIQFV